MALSPETTPTRKGTWNADVGIVDCDIHNGLRTPDVLLDYLPRRWHKYYAEIPGRAPGGFTVGAKPHAGIFRQDATPRSGGQPGSDLELMREQLLDRWDVRRAILSPLEIFDWPQQGEFGAALTCALNDWLEDQWLGRDDRLYGSIVVPIEDGPRAAREIERAASDPRFVQVLLTVRTREALGHSKYWPIYESAASHGLPVAIHVGGFGGEATGAGWPSFFLEMHISWPYPYHAHVVSLVHSGVFERFPTLQVVLEEGGLAWMPALMWRLDRTWHAMREQVPHLQELPSATIRKHFWYTTQPMEETEDPRHLLQMLAQLGMDDRIMFASDYPHWDFDAPDRILPPIIGQDLRRRIFAANAESLYRFEVSE